MFTFIGPASVVLSLVLTPFIGWLLAMAATYMSLDSLASEADSYRPDDALAFITVSIVYLLTQFFLSVAGDRLNVLLRHWARRARDDGN